MTTAKELTIKLWRKNQRCIEEGESIRKSYRMGECPVHGSTGKRVENNKKGKDKLDVVQYIFCDSVYRK